MQGELSTRVQEMFAAAAHRHRGGQLQEAERLYRSILAIDPSHADSLHLLGVIALQVGRYEESVVLIGKAIAADPRVPGYHNNLGNAERARGRLQAAVGSYEKAFALDPNYLEALYNQGVAFQELGRLDEATEVYQRVIRARPDHAAAHGNLGNVLQRQGQFDAALESYERALEARADFLPALVNRGNLLKGRGRLDEAIGSYRRALAVNPRYPEAHNNLGLALLEAGRTDEAIAAFQSALHTHPKYLEAHRNLGNALRERGNPQEAQTSYRRALALDPNDGEAWLGFTMAAIPVFADSVEQSSAAVATFDRALGQLTAWSREHLMRLGKSVGSTQPFYLAYRPADVTSSLSRYGELVCGAAAVNLHPSAGACAERSRASRMRMAIICGHVRSEHPVFEVLLKGILAHLQRDELEVFLYHTGSSVDEDTAWARAQVDSFVQGPKSTASWVDQIRKDGPDVIFYPEVGMDPVTCALAALRLAPVQAASWGHPVTTGLASIDLFFSGALLESAEADAHYRESLIRLPGTGVCTRARSIAAAAWDGDAPSGVRFALPHQPIKFDPEDDVLLTKIAKAVGACEFWLASPGKLGWAAERLRVRLAKAFRAEGLDPERYLRVTPWLPRERFLGYLDAMDVYLDSPAFSGYTTAWQALQRGVPIVTLEGGFMRQRLAAGLLRQIELPDGIAQSKEQYVMLAARFAEASRSAEGRATREAMRQAAHKADDNRLAVSALQEVLRRSSAARTR